MSYTALYRKYRPAVFSDVLGQDGIVRTLKNQLVNGKVSHAYLFCGTRGTGKTSLAKIFAKAINCREPVNGEPCGRCQMCTEISDERSLNVIEIDAASNNGVDNIRDIREEVRYTPTSGIYKVYIIDEVHMLSAGAYNALLKTLEEPPGHVIFILATTDPHKIPATILSRCQRYDFRRIPSGLIADRLFECVRRESMEADAAALKYIANVSDGSMRDALSLLDRIASFFEGERITLEKALDITGSVDIKCFFELTDCLNGMDSSGALNVVNEIVQKGRDIGQIVLEALSHFRSLIIAKTTDTPSQILDISEDSASKLKEQSERMDTVRLTSYIEAFSELQATARYSPNARVLLEITLIKLCNPEIVNNSYEELYAKVYELEKKLDSGNAAFNTIRERTSESAPCADEFKDDTPKIKVLLPADFNTVKERFNDIKRKLAEDRNELFFAAVIERTEVGFLDDSSIYIIFEDETNEDILKKDLKKLEKLSGIIEDATGAAVNIKTITKERFEKQSKGIELVSDNKSEGEKLIETAKNAFGDLLEEN